MAEPRPGTHAVGDGSGPLPHGRGSAADRARATVAHAPLAMAETVGETHVLAYVNPAFCRLAGREREALVGRPFHEAVPESRDDGSQALLGRVFHTGEAGLARDLSHPDPKLGVVSWSYAVWPLLEGEQPPRRLLVQVTDTTELVLDRQHGEQAVERVRDINERLLVSGLRVQEQAEEEKGHLTTLLEHERELVRALTESFLGRTPRLPGLQVASLYEPAAKAERVGGDFFDFFEIDPNLLGVVIGDVCGKGLPAAVYTAMTKYTLRAYALEEPDPQKVLYRLNQALYNEIIEEGMFVTLVYGVLDLTTGTFTYVNAGHPAPVLYTPIHPLRGYPTLRAGRPGSGPQLRPRSSLGPPATEGGWGHSCQLLEATGGLVGGVPHWEYPQRSVSLKPGAVLVLFTDGITEGTGGKDLLDGEGVSAILQERAGENVDAIARTIFARARDLAGENLEDDVAIVVICRA
jgi:PAS domain S-box-containing protein